MILMSPLLLFPVEMMKYLEDWNIKWFSIVFLFSSDAENDRNQCFPRTMNKLCILLHHTCSYRLICRQPAWILSIIKSQSILALFWDHQCFTSNWSRQRWSRDPSMIWLHWKSWMRFPFSCYTVLILYVIDKQEYLDHSRTIMNLLVCVTKWGGPELQILV